MNPPGIEKSPVRDPGKRTLKYIESTSGVGTNRLREFLEQVDASGARRGRTTCTEESDQMIRTVLVDDDLRARQKLRQDLKQMENFDVIGECTSIREVVDVAKLTTPDLLILGVRTPTEDGFDVADALSSVPALKRPHIVFVTASDRYAIRAFEMHAIDYVLKPYSIERLRTAMNRVRERRRIWPDGARDPNSRSRRCNHGSIDEYQTIGDRYGTSLLVKSRGRILFVPIREIRFIEAEENYVRICTGSGSHLVRGAIGRLETRMDPNLFLRVHRSAIVNLHYMKEIKNEPNGDAKALLVTGETVAISRSYRMRIQKLLNI
jgi:two-component system LytT family response regulator